MNTKLYEEEKKRIKEADNLGYLVLDGMFVVSPLRSSIPVQMATDILKDTLLPPSFLERRKRAKGGAVSCCNCTTEGSDVSSSSQTGSTSSVCVAGGYFGARRVSQPVEDDKTEVSLGNHSSERDLTTDKLLKASSYIPNTETPTNSIYFYDFSCLSILRDYITAVLLSPALLSERTRILQVTW